MAPIDPNKKPESKPGQSPLAESVDHIPVNEETGEAFIDFGTVAPIHEGASGVVPLDELPADMSSQSLTSWTEVIRRQRAAAEEALPATPIPDALPVRVDSPSDRDLLGQDVFNQNLPPTGNSSRIPLASKVAGEPDTQEIPEADLPVIAAEASEATDHGKAQIGGPLPTSPSPSNTSSDVWSNAKQLPPDADEIAFGSDDDGSSAMLGDMPSGGSEGTRSSILDVLLSESNLEIPLDGDNSPEGVKAMLENIANTPFRTARPTDPGLELPPEQPKLPSLPSLGAIPGFQFGADLPAGLEEGTTESRFGDQIIDLPPLGDSDDAVDLYSEEFPQPSLTDSGSLSISEEAVEEAARKQRIVESSSVDLSSRPSMHESEFDMESIPPIGLLPDDEEGRINMNAPLGKGPGGSSAIMPINLDAEADNYRQTSSARNPRPGSSNTTPRPLQPVSAGSRSGLYGTVAGLLIGAGGMYGAYAGGVLSPNTPPAIISTGADQTELADARRDAAGAKLELSDLRDSVAKALAEAKIEGDGKGLGALVADRNKAVAKAGALAIQAEMLKEKADAAAKAETAAQAQLKSAQTALAESEATASNFKKGLGEANTILADIAKSFKDAGLETTKPAELLREQLAKKAEAEKLAKDTEAKAEKAARDYAVKLEAANKQLTEAGKIAEEARKSAAEAKLAAAEVAKAREAADGTLKALGEKLARAKFVPANADAAAILKGIDDAIKAGSTDATNSLREELVKLRDGAAKGKADLEALTVRQQNTEKLARAAEAQAKKAADELKSLAEKASSDIAAAKTGSEKLSAQVAELRTKNEESLARASEAEKSLAKTMSELTTTKNQLGGQIAKLKTENESLNRDLASVKELSLAIKNQGGPRDPLVKVDPATVADKYFSGGARAFHAGNYSEAEASLVKGIAIFGDDARYHYLLGLALHSQGKMKEAETAFARGAELESQGRPGGKSIDAILERVQGSVRQIVNAHRP